MNRSLNFVKCFFFSLRTIEMIICFLAFIPLIQLVILIDFLTLNQSCIPGIKSLDNDFIHYPMN